HFYFQQTDETLFTENETNTQRLFNFPNKTAFVKDAFHEAIAQGNQYMHQLCREKQQGTKFAPVYRLKIEGKSSATITLRLVNQELAEPFGKNFETVFKDRLKDADEFYESFHPKDSALDTDKIQRQAFAGLIWTKQYYHYDIERWLEGDPGLPKPPANRKNGRNNKWKHLKNEDVISMPDKWEYPWYAAWDLAFHCVPMSLIDPVFAKNQLILMCREWYMSPLGQLPAYEWNFFDVNPPVHAWAALSVYRIEKAVHKNTDVDFLKRIFQKLLINFTWWINRKDENDNNIFEGGFLGLDNIGVFDRSNLPPGSFLEQVDGTSWMAMYALNMMDIALEIAVHDAAFEDVATKFYEHFVMIAESLNEVGLWDEEDSFYYDLLYLNDGSVRRVKIRSMVGLSVLFAVSIIDSEKLKKLPDFIKKINYFRNYRQKTGKYLPIEHDTEDGSTLVTMVNKERLVKLLQKMLDENEFLSPGGIRALSKFHDRNPYSLNIHGNDYGIRYVPGESDSGMFGGNSNWRGPVWMPVNYLLVKALKKYHQFYGNNLKVEYPTGSGNFMNLLEVSNALAKRI
ncbi:MAG: glucosidase, partial [Verrucomicrobia bacterium]|nr:glucosidase [Cytophagales bacterium]